MMSIHEAFEFAFAVIDGKYGWMNEALTILALVIIVNFFVKALLKHLHSKYDRQKKYWKDSFVKALYKPLSYYVWVIAFTNCLDLISQRVVNANFFASETMLLIIKVGAVLAFGWFLFRWKQNVICVLLAKTKTHELAIDQNKVDMISKFLTLMIFFVSALLLMEAMERSIQTLIAFGGLGGIVLAFAFQEIGSNFFSGLMIYITHPFGVGDWVNLPERSIEGHVEEIGWYMTRIRTFQKRPIYVPNSIFSKIMVMTPSRMSHRQFKETIGLRYQDMPLLKSIISDIKIMLQEHLHIDHTQRIMVHFHSFGPYSLDIVVDAYTYIVDTEEYAKTKEDLLFKIAEILTKHGAQFAYPTTAIAVPEGLMVQNVLPT